MCDIIQEYFRDYYKKHIESASKLSTVSGRMAESRKSSNGTDASTLLKFIDMELNYKCNGGVSPICIIYMPEMYSGHKFNGKIIIEAKDHMSHYFELQLARTTNFDSVLHQVIEEGIWDGVHRYYNMHLAKNEAINVVQSVLFSSLFRQRFLMTTASRVLGSMTTQRLVSSAGHVFSFRQCVLNE